MSPLRPIRLAAPLLLAMLTTSTLSHAQAPADSTVGRRRIQLLPALGSAPESGLQYGLTGFAVFERPRVERTRPAVLIATAIRTAKQQTRVSIEGERWSTGNSQRVGGSVVWQEFPLPYYGVGDSTPDSARELFTPKGIEATASLQQRMLPGVYGLSSIRVVDQSVRPDSAGILRSGAVTGSTGGRTVELTVGTLADTRDNLFAPSRGHLVQLTYGRSTEALGADFDFGRLRLDARHYRAFRGSHVLATQLLATGVDGDAPFDQVALVGGGDIMRGYARGRYRDRWFAGAQAEYRTPVVRRVGAVLFGGGGFVADRLGGLGSGTLLPTYGAGLRVQLDPAQRTAVRVDYGRGRSGNSGLYIGFNQAF